MTRSSYTRHCGTDRLIGNESADASAVAVVLCPHAPAGALSSCRTATGTVPTQLCEWRGAKMNKSSFGSCASSSPGCAQSLHSYMVTHASLGLTLSTACKHCFVSEATARRALLRLYGKGFHTLLDEIRISLIMDLLDRDGSMKDDALTWAAGWKSRTSLYAAVRRVTGTSLHDLRIKVSSATPAPQIVNSGEDVHQLTLLQEFANTDKHQVTVSTRTEGPQTALRH